MPPLNIPCPPFQRNQDLKQRVGAELQSIFNTLQSASEATRPSAHKGRRPAEGTTPAEKAKSPSKKNQTAAANH